ncbi:MAG: ATP-binding protein [Armatimonadetes bacterium]|nr:ATP-binding protein [Armatimonadota bacterium]
MNSPNPNTVQLMIPCRPEYVSVARLTTSGVASRAGFSYDGVEDLRLAVGEACASAVERALKDNIQGAAIHISWVWESGRLVIDVLEPITRPESALPGQDGNGTEKDYNRVLMELLVDSVEIFNRESGGTCIRLVKSLERS